MLKHLLAGAWQPHLRYDSFLKFLAPALSRLSAG